MDKYGWLLLIVVPLYQLGLAILMFAVLSGKMKKMFQKRGVVVYNLTATIIEDVVIYDIPACATSHEVDTIKTGTIVIIKEIKPMIDGRWYLIEIGSEVGYCPKEHLML